MRKMATIKYEKYFIIHGKVQRVNSPKAVFRGTPIDIKGQKPNIVDCEV